MFHAGACCVFKTVFPTHRHPASTSPAHPVSVPIRHPSDQSSAVTSFEADIYIYIANATRCQVHTRYTHACGVRVAFLKHGGGALGRFDVASLHLQSIMDLRPLHVISLFSFLSKRSGRSMPPAERSALYLVLVP